MADDRGGEPRDGVGEDLAHQREAIDGCDVELVAGVFGGFGGHGGVLGLGLKNRGAGFPGAIPDIRPASADLPGAIPDIRPASADLPGVIPDIRPASADLPGAIPDIRPASADLPGVIPDIRPASADLPGVIPDIRPASADLGGAIMRIPDHYFHTEMVKNSHFHPSSLLTGGIRQPRERSPDVGKGTQVRRDAVETCVLILR